MKIIDFEQKGNLVRFYLGQDTCEDYTGNNSGKWHSEKVLNKYIVYHIDHTFNFDYNVVNPISQAYCSKEDLKKGNIPCIIVVDENCKAHTWEEFEKEAKIKLYFNQTVDLGFE